MTFQKLKKALETEVPNLEVDKGIYEFCLDTRKTKSGIETSKSFGISYEHIDESRDPVYIVNLFINGEYINISGWHKTIPEAIKAIEGENCKWMFDEDNGWTTFW